MAVVELHIKVEEDGNKKLEVTVTNFVTDADLGDTVKIYNDANAVGGIAVTLFFPGKSPFVDRYLEIAAGPNPETYTVTNGADTYSYEITANLPESGGYVLIDPRFIIP